MDTSINPFSTFCPDRRCIYSVLSFFGCRFWVFLEVTLTLAALSSRLISDEDSCKCWVNHDDMERQMIRTITITVDDSHLPKIQTISRLLQKVGVHVNAVMPTIGIISASTDLDNSTIKKIPGVLYVENELQFQLPHPDSPIQ